MQTTFQSQAFGLTSGSSAQPLCLDCHYFAVTFDCCSPFQGPLFLSQFHTDVSISLTVSAEESAEDLRCSSPLGDEHVGIGLSLKASSSINWNVFQFL